MCKVNNDFLLELFDFLTFHTYRIIITFIGVLLIGGQKTEKVAFLNSLRVSYQIDIASI